MPYLRASADVPSSIALPSDPEDQSRDYPVTVDFEWREGTPASGLSGPPENYDPGEADEFVILSDDFERQEEAIVEWLDANWERPEPDHDYLRELQEEQRVDDWTDDA